MNYYVISINMISPRMLFFIILAVRGLDYFPKNRPSPLSSPLFQLVSVVTKLTQPSIGWHIRDDTSWRSPMSYNYKFNDILNINIILENVPPIATNYSLFVQTENCDKNMKTKREKKHGFQCYVSIKNGPILTDGTITIITQILNKRSVTVFIDLLTSKEVCATKRIMDGVRDEHADKVENEFRTACLNNYNNPCEIIVDFKNKCEDSTPPERNNAQETHSSSTSTTPQAPKKTKISSNLEPEAEKPQDQQHIEAQANPDQPQDPTSDKTKYCIGIGSVAGIIILISLIYVVIKKCYRKSSDSEQTLQLETASTNMVLYAELDIKPGNAPPPARTEDPNYAKIIGVLRPQNENVKK